MRSTYRWPNGQLGLRSVGLGHAHPRAALISQARPNNTQAVLGQSEDTRAHCASPWNKSICHSSSLWTLSYLTVISLLCVPKSLDPSTIFLPAHWTVSCRASPPYQGMAQLSDRAGTSRAMSCLDRHQSCCVMLGPGRIAVPWAGRRASGLIAIFSSFTLTRSRARGISRHFLLDTGSPARDATRKAKLRNARKKGGLPLYQRPVRCRLVDTCTLYQRQRGLSPAPHAPYIFQLLLSLSLFRPNQLWFWKEREKKNEYRSDFKARFMTLLIHTFVHIPYILTTIRPWCWSMHCTKDESSLQY